MKGDPALEKCDTLIEGIMFTIGVQKRTMEKDKTDSPLIHFFLEDDEYWHWKFCVDALWIADLNQQLSYLETYLREGCY